MTPMKSLNETYSNYEYPEFLENLENQPFKIAVTGLMAFNFKPFTNYHRSWTITQIQVFEYLLQGTIITGNKTILIEIEPLAEILRIEYEVLWDTLLELEEKGLITFGEQGENNSMYNVFNVFIVTINFTKIKDSINKIYNLDAIKPSLHIEIFSEWEDQLN